MFDELGRRTPRRLFEEADRVGCRWSLRFGSESPDEPLLVGAAVQCVLEDRRAGRGRAPGGIEHLAAVACGQRVVAVAGRLQAPLLVGAPVDRVYWTIGAAFSTDSPMTSSALPL